MKLGVNGAYDDAIFTDGVTTAYSGSVLNYGPVGSVSRFTGDLYGWVDVAGAGPFYVAEYETKKQIYLRAFED